MGFHVLRHDCSATSVLWKRDCGTKLHDEAQSYTKNPPKNVLFTSKSDQEVKLYDGESWIRRGETRIPHQAFSITASLLLSPPLFAMLTSFQFTQSALPTRLAVLFPCDSCWPIAAQAHLVPCETGASLHYITAATGCHGNTHGHYHTVLACVCVCVEHHFVCICQCAKCV